MGRWIFSSLEESCSIYRRGAQFLNQSRVGWGEGDNASETRSDRSWAYDNKGPPVSEIWPRASNTQLYLLLSMVIFTGALAGSS